MHRAYLIIPATLLLTMAQTAQAEMPEYHLVIKNHRFEPADLAVPAGQKIKLVIENHDSTPEEFESHRLNREKIVPANSKAVVYVGPLEPGSYPYFGDFNPQTATGTITAK
jgi:plastocyanin